MDITPLIFFFQYMTELCALSIKEMGMNSYLLGQSSVVTSVTSSHHEPHYANDDNDEK